MITASKKRVLVSLAASLFVATSACKHQASNQSADIKQTEGAEALPVAPAPSPASSNIDFRRVTPARTATIPLNGANRWAYTGVYGLSPEDAQEAWRRRFERIDVRYTEQLATDKGAFATIAVDRIQPPYRGLINLFLPIRSTRDVEMITVAVVSFDIDPSGQRGITGWGIRGDALQLAELRTQYPQYEAIFNKLSDGITLPRE